jgi:ABC-type transporter Mla subunit MlaD
MHLKPNLNCPPDVLDILKKNLDITNTQMEDLIKCFESELTHLNSLTEQFGINANEALQALQTNIQKARGYLKEIQQLLAIIKELESKLQQQSDQLAEKDEEIERLKTQLAELESKPKQQVLGGISQTADQLSAGAQNAEQLHADNQTLFFNESVQPLARSERRRERGIPMMGVKSFMVAGILGGLFIIGATQLTSSSIQSIAIIAGSTFLAIALFIFVTRALAKANCFSCCTGNDALGTSKHTDMSETKTTSSTIVDAALS